jgi:hypothetical protein
LLPETPGARRIALIAWSIAAIGGTIAVWWLSSYLETLTTLAQTDRAAALELFRSRVIPALLVVVGVAVVAGAFLMRQGLHIVRTSDRQRRTMGSVIAATGFILAAVPLVLLSVVLWMIRRA